MRLNCLHISWWICFLSLSITASAQTGWHSLGNVSSVAMLPQGVELATETGRLRVVALSPNIVRVRNTQSVAFPPEHSFAVLPNAFPKPPTVHVEQAADSITITTS